MEGFGLKENIVSGEKNETLLHRTEQNRIVFYLLHNNTL